MGGVIVRVRRTQLRNIFYVRQQPERSGAHEHFNASNFLLLLKELYN